MAFVKQVPLHYFKSFTMNLGPQHPAAHGVLRLVLELDGEIILSVDPHIGLLHRGTEKLMEFKNFLQNLGYFDRLDYVSTMSQEHVYCLALERLFSVVPSTVDSYVRMIFLELTRILNHLLAITTHALDVGALTPFLWCFEEREHIMGFYEEVSGSRLHTCFFQPGGLKTQVTAKILESILLFCYNLVPRLNDVQEILSQGRIWRQRLRGIGVVDHRMCTSYGFSGVMLRGSGIPWDLRATSSYEFYLNLHLNFRIILGEYGDCYDRYYCRLLEIYESTSLVAQLCCLLLEPTSDILSSVSPGERSTLTMEQVIRDFHYYTAFSDKLPFLSDCYVAAEAPKGETGVYLLQRGSQTYRCKVKAPGFLHLQGLPAMVKGHFLADLVTVIGTQDIVFGEIDR